MIKLSLSTYFAILFVPCISTSISNFAMCVLVFIYYPETGGLSLEAVDTLFVDTPEQPYVGWRQAVKRSIKMHRKRNIPEHLTFEHIPEQGLGPDKEKGKVMEIIEVENID